MKKHYYLLSLTIPLAVFLSLYFKGPWSYTALIFSFGILPLLELFLPTLKANHSFELENQLKNDRYFDLLLWIMVPIQYLLLIYFLNILKYSEIQTYELVGLVLSMGLSCGVLGINVAHELGHRTNSFEQSLAKMLLSTSLYWHFFIEHNKGHHRNVSTPKDPESSRLNESIYSFWFRSILGSFWNAFKIDRQEMYKAILTQNFLLLAIYWIWGQAAMTGFILSAIFGIILLESVNYIEHYGLSRKINSDGHFEKVGPMHSWNADNPLSRAILFDLSRHSDHHANSSKKYQTLSSHEEGPQMPTGYPGMILLALVPPLWFKIINPRIKMLQKES